MSADFWAGYISGAIGILIGNPLDLIKTRMQSKSSNSINAAHPTTYANQFTSYSSLIRGATAPILGYGALNALLFMTYNRMNMIMSPGYDATSQHNSVLPSYTSIFFSGIMGGVAIWVVSTPTELIKCREQISTSPISSLSLVKGILKSEGIKGLYRGGTVTLMRDSLGYGVYFWAYEFSSRMLKEQMGNDQGPKVAAAQVLLCGGVSGVLSWTSCFPLDVLKTRIQTQAAVTAETQPLLGATGANAVLKETRIGVRNTARKIYAEEGAGVFFRGLGICSVRAFVVNAAQWAVYEWIMKELRVAVPGSGIGGEQKDGVLTM